MTVKTFSASDAVVVTAAAGEHFKNILDKSGRAAIRVTLKEAGCTGFKYVIEDVVATEEGDIQKVLDNGVLICIDPAHVGALQGTSLDYVTQGVNKNLVINNPNVKDACGCGESFSV